MEATLHRLLDEQSRKTDRIAQRVEELQGRMADYYEFNRIECDKVQRMLSNTIEEMNQSIRLENRLISLINLLPEFGGSITYSS